MLRTGDRVDVWLADDAASVLRSERSDVVGDVMVVDTSADASALDERSDLSGSCSLTLQVSTTQAGQLLAAAASGGLAAVLRPTQEPPPAQSSAQTSVVVPRIIGRRFERGFSIELVSADGHSLSRQWLAEEKLP